MNQRWLLEFANNFVNFSQFYDPDQTALMQMGTLVLDGRRFSLTIRVHDRKTHKARAKDSMIYLLYVEVQPKVKGDKADVFEVCAAVTSRSRGNLYVGKQGIFITREGEVRDAVVVDILENPISVWEAFKRPFLQLFELMASLVERFSAARQKQIESAVEAKFTAADKSIGALKVEEPKAEAPEEKPAEPDPSATAGLQQLAVSGSIAVAALSSAMAYVAKTLTSINLLSLLGVVLALVLIAVFPAVMLAFVRLRQRDLALVLEASGWAINYQMPLPRWAGGVFTRRAPFPPEASMPTTDLLLQYEAKVATADSPLVRYALVIVTIVLVAGGTLYMTGGWPLVTP